MDILDKIGNDAKFFKNSELEWWACERKGEYCFECNVKHDIKVLLTYYINEGTWKYEHTREGVTYAKNGLLSANEAYILALEDIINKYL